MIEPFRYEPKPAHVLFGSGRIAETARAVELVKGRHAIVLSTRGHENLADTITTRLGALAAGKFARAVMHTPVDVTETAHKYLREIGADCIVAIGGGSAIGLGKALAMRTDLPQIAIPTTYAGSEMTDILGETRDGRKVTQRGAKILPEIVIYDVDLTLGLPAKVSAASGLNAIAHAVEALYAPDRNPVIELMAEEGIRALAEALPRIKARENDIDAREMAQYGAFLCGSCLGAASMALHHKLCHALGGTLNLPHAETHAVILPHAAAYNTPAVPYAMMRVAGALGSDNAAMGLHVLKEKLLGPLSLADLGMTEDDIEKAARAATANPYWNPRPVQYDSIHTLIDRAWRGAPPE